MQSDTELREFGRGDNVHEQHVAAEPAEAGVREGVPGKERAVLLENLRHVSRPHASQHSSVLA